MIIEILGEAIAKFLNVFKNKCNKMKIHVLLNTRVLSMLSMALPIGLSIAGLMVMSDLMVPQSDEEFSFSVNEKDLEELFKITDILKGLEESSEDIIKQKVDEYDGGMIFVKQVVVLLVSLFLFEI